MEKLSRVEKYKELRESMDAVQERSSGGKPTIEPVELRRQLQQIDQPQQGETQSRHSHTPPRFSKEIDVEQTYDTGKETFHNEYLDDFLNEVKEYNIEKGNRLSDNTQIDILLQLNPETGGGVRSITIRSAKKPSHRKKEKRMPMYPIRSR